MLNAFNVYSVTLAKNFLNFLGLIVFVQTTATLTGRISLIL